MTIVISPYVRLAANNLPSTICIFRAKMCTLGLSSAFSGIKVVSRLVQQLPCYIGTCATSWWYRSKRWSTFCSSLCKDGKDVSIPVCEGAATAKSPWNAPELFDLSVLEGESTREWLLFDKPRRAFESGNRKQRSLPDYSDRGWHEARKQVMKEFGGLKRSYYMDPQPLTHFEWHLYEYEISNFDDLALYRLKFKLVDANKNARVKLTSNSLVDLQQQMGRLNAENSVDTKENTKSRTKATQKDIAESMYPTPHLANQKENMLNFYHASYQMLTVNENSGYGPILRFYSVGNDCCGTKTRKETLSSRTIPY